MPGDIIGRAIIIHRDPDDFRSQPSGNAGAKIACGIISRV
jgi:Cu-Zn family superoxide dismutase